MSGNALVISGGTAKGAYAAGLVHGLFSSHPELGPKLRYFSGTSTGALIVPMLALWAATGDRAHLDVIPERYAAPSSDVWRSEPDGFWGHAVAWIARPFVKEQADLVGRIVESGAGLDTRPLLAKIERDYTDELLRDLFSRRDRVECIVNCVSAQTGSVDKFSSADPKMTPEVFRRAIYASCLQPIFMPLEDVHHPERPRAEQYMDGGIRDVIPIRAAWYAGATRVLAIALSDRHTKRDPGRYEGPGGVPKLLIRVMVGMLDQEIADDDIHEARYIAAIGRLAAHAPPVALAEALELIDEKEHRLFRGERLHDLHVHRPAPDVKLTDAFEWSEADMRRWIGCGEDVATTDEGRRMADFLSGARRAAREPAAG